MSVFFGPPVDPNLEQDVKQHLAWYKMQFPLFPPPPLSMVKQYLTNMHKPYQDDELAEIYERMIPKLEQNPNLEQDVKQYLAWYKSQFPLFQPPSLIMVKQYLTKMRKPYQDDELAEIYKRVNISIPDQVELLKKKMKNLIEIQKSTTGPSKNREESQQAINALYDEIKRLEWANNPNSYQNLKAQAERDALNDKSKYIM